MKRMLAVVALFLLAIPAVVCAAPSRPGAYVSGFLGFNQTKDANLETIDYFNGTAQNYSLDFDPGVYIGGTGGYDFGLLRLEGELSYRDANITNITSDFGARYRGVDSNLGVLAMMANCFLDLENGTPVTPYLGGGAGFATLFFDEDVYDQNGDPIFYEDTATTYALQAGGGLDISLNPRFSLDVGYRYFRTGKATFDKYWDLENKLKLESHNFAVGFKVKF